MARDKIICGPCGNWIIGIPAGRCGHPDAGFLWTSNEMVYKDAGKDCPLNVYEAQRTRNAVVVRFTKEELRALQEILLANPCNSGCVYEEMEKSKKNCNECEFTKSINSIINKIE